MAQKTTDQELEDLLEDLYEASIRIHEKLYSLAEKQRSERGKRWLARKLGAVGKRAEMLSIELSKLLLPPPA